MILTTFNDAFFENIANNKMNHMNFNFIINSIINLNAIKINYFNKNPMRQLADF